ncbi:MAG TPA: cytochrome c maturation protein CcmE [Chryseolinea sp.]|jgi:cytochrome c-type biogenesis protein CcmE|uniref:Cytochrome c-type biogenesis protein CcmE n=1 Tax=Chryseolinea serpens TaxID=947013 RepID=A0A1M5NT31_9BACT|nr:cytochrome c maturation protein CcmE [Chryseolinea serpens]SHG92627.1 cytochrome c-type biogenesis protein CcmE [Chryseolinea serpens]
MKKSHILILVVIAVAIGIIVSTSNDASTYVGFDEALSLSTSGNKKDIHVVGELKKDDEGHVIGITEGADRVSFSFVMIDDTGKEQRVNYNQPMPADFLRSEKVVVIGSYHGTDFNASKILLKCPSKYQEQKINV